MPAVLARKGLSSVKATRFHKDVLEKEFPALREVDDGPNWQGDIGGSKEPWITRLSPDDNVYVKRVDESLLRSTFAEVWGGGLPESCKPQRGAVVLRNGKWFNIANSVTGSRQFVAESIGAQIADKDVDYIPVLYMPAQGQKQLTICKIGDFDLSAWAREQRRLALAELEAEMALTSVGTSSN